MAEQGYGIEAWCADGLVTGRYSTGTNSVALALYRRLITPRGSLLGVGDEAEEANYGFDVSSYIGKVGTAVALNALPGIIRGELMKDERVQDIAITINTVTGSDGLIDLEITVDAVLFDNAERFSLTILSDDVSTELLGISVDEAA